MKLVKGDIIREVKTNPDAMLSNTTENSTLVYKVVRVNKKTYGLECIDGYMKGTQCNRRKDFKESYTDIYGTTTTITLVS